MRALRALTWPIRCWLRHSISRLGRAERGWRVPGGGDVDRPGVAVAGGGPHAPAGGARVNWRRSGAWRCPPTVVCWPAAARTGRCGCGRPQPAGLVATLQGHTGVVCTWRCTADGQLGGQRRRRTARCGCGRPEAADRWRPWRATLVAVWRLALSADGQATRQWRDGWDGAAVGYHNARRRRDLAGAGRRDPERVAVRRRSPARDRWHRWHRSAVGRHDPASSGQTGEPDGRGLGRRAIRHGSSVGQRRHRWNRAVVGHHHRASSGDPPGPSERSMGPDDVRRWCSARHRADRWDRTAVGDQYGPTGRDPARAYRRDSGDRARPRRPRAGQRWYGWTGAIVGPEHRSPVSDARRPHW